MGTSIGMSFARQTNATVVVTVGNANVTFTTAEKILQVWRLDGSSPIVLDEVLLAELRENVTPSSDKPTAWAIYSTASNSVTIRLNAAPATAYTLYADVIAEVSDLSGSNEPAFPESFHDILIEGVLKEEYRKQEKVQLARDSAAEFQQRLSDLRMFVAKSNYLDIQQGKHPENGVTRAGGGGTASTVVTGPSSATDNAIARWDGTGGRIIQNSGITIADGASGTLAGSNSGDVTLAGTPDYITLSSQVLTRGEIQNDDIRDSGALSVVGRSANSTGDVADISASAASGAVLRESGSALGFGTVATAGLTNDAVTDPKLRDSGALSVIGRSANSGGDPADISASAASGAVLRESGSTLGFGTVATAGIADAAVTYAKIQDVSATARGLGRNTSGSGDVEEVTLTQILDWIGSAAQGDILYRDSSAWARLGAGTSGHFLKTQGAAANPTWALAQGFKYFKCFPATANDPPASAYATLDSRNSHYVLDFDGATDEEAVFSDVLAPDYSGAGLTVETYWAFTSATSGSLRVQAAIERIDASSLDIDADSFASFQSAGGTAPGTNGQVIKVTITFTSGAQMDSLAAGEAYRVKIRRDADGTSGTDDIATDAELLRVVVRET